MVASAALPLSALPPVTAACAVPHGFASSSGGRLAVLPLQTRQPTRHHQYAERLPPPRKTGDELIDGDAHTRYDMFKQIVTECIEDDSHVPALFSCLRKRMQAQSQADGVESSQRFKVLTTFRSIEAEWLCEWVSSVSDLSVMDLVTARRFDGDAVLFLASFATQIPLRLNMPPECFVKGVLKRLLDSRTALLGRRLSVFKASGGIKSDGSLNLLQLAYRPVFDSDDRLTSLLHCSGKEVAVPEALISKSWVLVDNYSDWNAHFRKDPMPPVKCHLFYKGSAAAGPYCVPALTASSKVFKDSVRQHHDDWTAARLVETGVTANHLAAVELIQKQDCDRRQAGAAVARSKALDSLKVKRQRRSIVL